VTNDGVPLLCSPISRSHVLCMFSPRAAYPSSRCGFLALNRDAIGLYDEMLKVQDTIAIAPSRVAQVAALGALRAGRSWVHEKVATLSTGRNAIMQAMEPVLNPIMGGLGAMYVMGKLPAASRIQDDEEVARMLVRDFGIAVIPGSFCGFPGWIRVCYANLDPDACLIGKVSKQATAPSDQVFVLLRVVMAL